MAELSYKTRHHKKYVQRSSFRPKERLSSGKMERSPCVYVCVHVCVLVRVHVCVPVCVHLCAKNKLMINQGLNRSEDEVL